MDLFSVLASVQEAQCPKVVTALFARDHQAAWASHLSERGQVSASFQFQIHTWKGATISGGKFQCNTEYDTMYQHLPPLCLILTLSFQLQILVIRVQLLF